jgi:hypothetical protein
MKIIETFVEKQDIAFCWAPLWSPKPGLPEEAIGDSRICSLYIPAALRRTSVLFPPLSAELSKEFCKYLL